MGLVTMSPFTQPVLRAQPLPLPALLLGMVLARTDPAAGELPPVLVMVRNVPGFDHIENGRAVSAKGFDVREQTLVSFLNAFDGEHPYDTHFVLYHAVADDGYPRDTCPRLTKPGLISFLHDEGKFATAVVAAYIGCDYDLPNHQRWTPATLAMVEDTLAKAGERNVLFKHPTVCYRTRAGLRLAWALTQAIQLEGRWGLEDHLRGMVGDAYLAGLQVDATCKDWTRLFRLPAVQRPKGEDEKGEKEATAQQPYFSISYGRCDLRAIESCPEHVIAFAPRTSEAAVSAFRCIHEHAPAEYQRSELARTLFENGGFEKYVGRDPYQVTQAASTIELGEQPVLVDAIALLYKGERKQRTKDFGRLRMLFHNWTEKHPSPAAQHAWDVLDNERLIFTDAKKLEGLHEGIQQVVSALSRFMAGEGHGTPQMLYAMVFEHANRANALRREAGLKGSRDTAELEREVWDLVSRFWRNDLARKLAFDQERQDEEERKQAAQLLRQQSADSAANLVKEQMRRWASGVELTDQELDALAMRALIVEVSGQGFFVLTADPDGSLHYSDPAKTLGGTLNLIRDSGLDVLLDPLKGRDKDGNVTFKTEADLRWFSTLTVNDMRVTSSRLVAGDRLLISRNERGRLQYGFVRKLPGMAIGGEAAYYEEVDEFLHMLGTVDYEVLCDYIAAFMHIERPLAALEIAGHSSAGKRMMALALAQLTEARAWADFNALYDDNGFTDDWMRTPVLWADEAISAKGKRAINDIKRVVTGELNKINRKGIAAMQVEGFYRLVMTTNDDHIVEHTETTNQNDLHALALRVLHITATAECAEWIAKRGGSKYTHDWVTKKMPEHFRWLERTRYADVLARAGTRLLVEGKVSKANDETVSLVANNRHANCTLRALGDILSQDFDPRTGWLMKHPYPDVAAIDVEQDLLLVRSEALAEFINETFSDRNKPGHLDVFRILTKWAVTKEPVRRRMPHVKGREHRPRLQALKLSEIIGMLSRAGSKDDFRGNGIINDAYYRERLPALYAGLTAPDQLPEIVAAAADAPPTQAPVPDQVAPARTVATMPTPVTSNAQRPGFKPWPRRSAPEKESQR